MITTTTTAKRFSVSLFLGKGKYANADAATLADINAKADELAKANPTAKGKPVIVDHDAAKAAKPVKAKSNGKIAKPSAAETDARVKAGDVFVAAPADLSGIMLAAPAKAAKGKPAKGKGLAVLAAIGKGKLDAGKAAKKVNAVVAKGKAAAAAKPVKVKAEKVAPALSARAQKMADAESGKLPTAPDFTAPTHAGYRKKLAELVELVKAGNVKALKAYPIVPASSSRKALDNYRNLAVIALTAKGKAAKAKANGKGK